MNHSHPTIEISEDNQTEHDDRLFITKDFTHVDPSDNELHRLGYYWPVQIALGPEKTI